MVTMTDKLKLKGGHVYTEEPTNTGDVYFLTELIVKKTNAYFDFVDIVDC